LENSAGIKNAPLVVTVTLIVLFYTFVECSMYVQKKRFVIHALSLRYVLKNNVINKNVLQILNALLNFLSVMLELVSLLKDAQQHVRTVSITFVLIAKTVLLHVKMAQIANSLILVITVEKMKFAEKVNAKKSAPRAWTVRLIQSV